MVLRINERQKRLLMKTGCITEHFKNPYIWKKLIVFIT